MSLLTPVTYIPNIVPENTPDPSSATLANSLPGPVSSRNEAFAQFHDSFPVQSPLPNKKVSPPPSSVALTLAPRIPEFPEFANFVSSQREPQAINHLPSDDDPEDNPTLPVWTPRKKCKNFTGSDVSKYDELSNAIRDILAPKPAVWGEDVEYLHSDEEPEQEKQTEPKPPNGDTDDNSLTLPPDGPLIEPRETPLSPTGTNQSHRNSNRLLAPLDPGIVRVWTDDGRRYSYQFDPSNPKINQDTTYGHIPGLYIGKRWHSRWGAAWDGTHNQFMAGIARSKSGDGVVAIAMNGGYEDDIDEGYRFIYSGSGGRSKTQKGHSVKAGQSKHQHWNRNNSALRQNVINERPVRVLRGYKGNRLWSPEEGFMYCGLYEVVACWVETGTSPLFLLSPSVLVS